MKIYTAKLELDCEIQIEAENAKRAHYLANYCTNVTVSKSENKEEYLEVLDSNVLEVELEIDNDDSCDTGEEWLICDHCNGEGTKCMSCEGLGEVRA